MAIDLSKLTTGANRPLPSQAQAKPAVSSDNSPAPSSRPAGDAVVLTEQAQQLTRAESNLANATGIDQGKVDSIKQAIAEGRYHVDPERLAQNITKFENELNGLLDD
ncbi:anti-sigma-28 factor, FlgM [Ferrimonas balearica DSM 9799]|uniref:Negative regulator of flagellin synthesis n=1 Tax=Ferrimonas balearica (strain DSM 9799 / CCM 4581 / KCTC 23876 / PAT) TaxID=550540 RepID=E1SQU6_FERBD|nr:flagellar biosynthesis anti-sigma factor FlgM [Ferrimonas balearica]MBY6017356.1 flagellar biosynthesis anti-sigma factor FlgM [Halomonas denitrificans]ADN76871.1 anti-sigma-28 factor, FlgM [Ferrimonas balearica DSM 9799]MBW3140145.1 flagellar biosynthesis anti-sigma factor FlgM [Ferrimonas balearica]MBW3165165.1 flagellar biosynthesis anti-sigma factor FlgM [Ferrimonas balearica]MBY5979970.1 flagellar biosynthesis anti-sigma factor FlgM [Ferrimonas balearica]